MDNNPIWHNDPMGDKVEGDYKDAKTGEHLGSDGVNDGKVHSIDSDDYKKVMNDFFMFTPEGKKEELSKFVLNTSSETSTNYTSTALNYSAYELKGSSSARNRYKSLTKNLNPSFVNSRTNIKALTRDITPAITRSIIETGRPSTGSKSGSTSSANKSNKTANNIAKNMGKVGNGMLVISTANSINNIVQADNKTDAVVKESMTAAGGGMGAVLGAEIGGGIGVWFGGFGAISGALIGGIIGGWGGSEIGAGAGDEINELRK